jgi:hypothetical protein
MEYRMAQFLKAQVRIQGVHPLLFHHFSVDSLPLVKQERTGVAGNDPEEWRKSVFATEAGQLYIESTYIFGCLREAGKWTKKGKGTMLPVISVLLMVLDDIIPIDGRYLPHGLQTPPEGNPTLPVSWMCAACVIRPPKRAIFGTGSRAARDGLVSFTSYGMLPRSIVLFASGPGGCQ